ncbi:pyridoxal-5'-phosphate-dependent enzyme family protein [Actinidia rufa]|uniref:tryptophan synthase n=1 Tax=Actinidia rufa TaxID=165716 RepID=A0A7J0FXL2_9ERIC|nr:pyridoxal-5'-phosphate-dependent enzyme family protein [Actinidia rufa]
MGRKSVVAATGAGQHGVATAAAACAKLSLECTIFMGSRDMERQPSNVVLMNLLGAQVKCIDGSFKDATSEAIRSWVGNLETSYYLAGTAVGPHPCPTMVREFQAIIGKETRKQAMEKWGGKPDVLVACVGTGSNALGLFHEFLRDEDVRLIGVEAAGASIDGGRHSATLARGDVGVYHGAMSYFVAGRGRANSWGTFYWRWCERQKILESLRDLCRLISVGEKSCFSLGDFELSRGIGKIPCPSHGIPKLEYPGVSPELSFLKDIGRAEFYTVTDQEALDAYRRLCRLEGIFPALEASHALAFLEKLCPTLPHGTKVVVNCSGRGDKDAATSKSTDVTVAGAITMAEPAEVVDCDCSPMTYTVTNNCTQSWLAFSSVSS